MEKYMVLYWIIVFLVFFSKGCHGSSEMTIISGCPVSQSVWHDKEPSLFNGHECRAKVKIYSPSPAKVTSPYEWKILEWDENPQTNKQTKDLANFVQRTQTNFCTLFWKKWIIDIEFDGYDILSCNYPLHWLNKLKLYSVTAPIYPRADLWPRD